MTRNKHSDAEKGRRGDTAPVRPAAGSTGNVFFDKVTVLGVGLIGASFALGVKHYGL